jgi:hypothetical protein
MDERDSDRFIQEDYYNCVGLAIVLVAYATDLSSSTYYRPRTDQLSTTRKYKVSMLHIARWA